MQVDTLLVNGTLVTHASEYLGVVGIKNGLIVSLSRTADGMEAGEIIDLEGKYLLPGAIDPHIHFQDPGILEREDLEHASAAAAAGGITTGLSHPMNDPPAVDLESYRFTLDCYEGRSYIDYGLHAGAVATNLDQADALWRKTGATALKLFLCHAGDDFPYLKDDTLLGHLRIMKKNGALALVHAENEELIRSETKRLRDAGRNDAPAFLESHPLVGELEAIGRAIFFLEQTGAQGIILHVGNVEGLKMIHAARNRGVKVWAETCPHYLTFAADDIVKYGPHLKFSPPMRDEQNRLALWEMMENGYVDLIGSDHCPHAMEEVEPGFQNIWDAPNGIPGLELFLPILLNGVNKKKLSLQKVVALTSYHTAQLYGLYPRKGALQVGSDADFTAVDLTLSKTYTKADQKSKCSFSPYFGMSLQGWPVMTMVRGKVVFWNGAMVGDPGHGIYIPRPKGGPTDSGAC